MLTKQLYDNICNSVLGYLDKANIVVNENEKKNIEVAEYGLGDFEKIGLGLIVYLNTERCCAKELVMLPGQTCPEHRHPRIGDDPGKEETFRCRWGEVYLLVEGPPTKDLKATVPEFRKDYFTVRHEIVLKPGEQYTLKPNTRHWFQAGPEGAVISEFSTKSRDDKDVYTDPEIDPALKRTY